LYKEFQRNIKSKMMLFIAQSSDAELSSWFANNELPEKLKAYLKDSFNRIGLIPGKVEITTCMVTKG
jgi:hypothetical protein